MIIEKIVIKSFGLITDMTLEFSDKVNVIEGQNEAGKSTIAAFIKYMLYGFDEADTSDTSERQKRINWDTGVAQGSMYVRVKDKRYLITRSTVPTDNLGRTTYREEASIVDLETGAPAFGKLCAGDVFFGVDRELFDNTAFVGQIGDSSINERSVKESIENILFSGSEMINNQRAAARISDKMHALLHESGNGGAIIDLIKREESLEDKLEACKEDNRLILEREAELHKIRLRRLEAEDKQQKLHELNSCYSNVMVIQTFDQLHALEEESEVKTEAYNAFIDENTRAGFVPDEEYLTDLAVARKSVNESYHNLGDAQDRYSTEKKAVGITKEIESSIALVEELGGEGTILKSAESHGKKKVGFLVGAITSLLLAIACGIFEIAVASAADMTGGKIAVGIIGGVLLIFSGVLAYLTFASHRKLLSITEKFGTKGLDDFKGKLSVIGEARARRDAMAESQEQARLAVERARNRYEVAKKTLTELILRWGEEPPASELSQFLDALEEKVRAFLEKKNELYEDKKGTDITVREIRRNLQDKSEIDVRAQVSPLKRKALAGVNHDEIISGIEDSKARIAEEDRLAFDVENELSMLKSRSGDPGEYYSRIQSVAVRREELQDKHKAYFIALDAITHASDNLRAGISPRLGEYATKMMEIMTDKKYSSFDVSDGLKVSFSDPNGEKKSIDFLSGGTRDMAYIAVRAALIDMLYTEKPPIIFDESFAHQDNVRAKAMMKMIKQLAKEGCQSFIFTCRGREAVIASETVKGAGIYKLSVIEEERV